MSADGGLYPELVRNRSFKDASRPVDWSLTNGADRHSTMSVDSSWPLNTLNLHSLRVNMDGRFTLEIGGSWGMNVVKGDR